MNKNNFPTGLILPSPTFGVFINALNQAFRDLDTSGISHQHGYRWGTPDVSETQPHAQHNFQAVRPVTNARPSLEKGWQWFSLPKLGGGKRKNVTRGQQSYDSNYVDVPHHEKGSGKFH